MIIAFSGYSRCGKDTATAMAVDMLMRTDHNIDTVYKHKYPCSDKFAATLKQILTYLFDLSEEEVEGSLKEIPLDRFSSKISPRQAMIQLGMLGRTWDENLWVNATIRRAQARGPDVVTLISDLRFYNEYLRVKEAGGFVVSITRPMVEPDPTSINVAEHDIQKIRSVADFVIHNNGSETFLRDYVERALIHIADKSVRQKIADKANE